MYFKTLTIQEWQQFENVSIRFHNRLTILTGSNGCGKTTLLNILGMHAGWSQQLLATPKADASTGIVRFFRRLFKGKDKSAEGKIGTIEYSSGFLAQISLSDSNSAAYALQISNQQGVRCFLIPSHRSVFRYQPIGSIPVAKKDRKSAFNEVSNSYRERYFGGGGNSSSYYMKNTLIGWMIHGYGVQRNGLNVMPPDAEQVRYFEGFESVLKKILPRSLGFQKIEVRNMEVVFVCNDARDEFVLETCSGGISTLIDIAWQVFMFAKDESDEFTVIIDEVENHLHPTLQRRLLQDLLDAFPRVRFIVSTHSPLVVGSVKDSYIYALIYNGDRKVESIELDFAGKPKTATEILDEVLGVPFTLPVWVEDKLNDILAKYLSSSAGPDMLGSLRKDLADVGLERLFPQAMATLLENRGD